MFKINLPESNAFYAAAKLPKPYGGVGFGTRAYDEAGYKALVKPDK